MNNIVLPQNCMAVIIKTLLCDILNTGFLRGKNGSFPLLNDMDYPSVFKQFFEMETLHERVPRQAFLSF